MQTVPFWLEIAALILMLLLLSLLLVSILFPSNRYLLRLGSRYSTYRRGEALGKAVPVGLLIAVTLSSLSVGDGLFRMVESNTDSNLSHVDIVVEAPSFIDRDLIPGGSGGVRTSAPVIMLDAAAFTSGVKGGGLRIMGVDGEFLELGKFESVEGEDIEISRLADGVVLNRKAADEFDVEKGDWILLTFNTHSREEELLPNLGGKGDVFMNLTVSAISGNSGLGRYREDSRDNVPSLGFVSLDLLQGRLDVGSKVNRFLLDMEGGGDGEDVMRLMDERLDMDTAGLEVVPAGEAGGSLVRSDEFFFPAELVDPEGKGVSTLSYFVDGISASHGDLSYSVVCGVEGEYGPEPGSILLNNWTAERLGVSVGDTVRLDYRRVGARGMLEDGNSSFIVQGIVNMEGFHGERELIPPIEGVTSELSCSDWHPGFDIDLDSIEDEDIEYWELYTTTPKAFISLEDARRSWSVPWGDTTALWFADAVDADALKGELSEDLDPSILDITIVPVRDRALSSLRALSIFPAMFLTFGSTVLISSSLILYAVVSSISAGRAGDWGILRSLGLNRRRILLFALYENVWPVFLGSLIGILLGWGLSMLMGLALGSIWSDTVEGYAIPLVVSTPSAIVSVAAGVLISLLVITLAVSREVMKVPSANTRGEEPGMVGERFRWWFVILGLASLLGGVLLSGSMFPRGAAGTYDVAGPFVLLSVMFGLGAACLLLFGVLRTRDGSDISLMVSANISRSGRRTASGILILSVVLTLSLSLTGMSSILERDLLSDIDSYGGGFDMLMETSRGLEGSGTDLVVAGDPDLLVEPLLTYGEEGGTCSNMNAVYPPRLLGIPEEMMEGTGFRLKERMDTGGKGLSIIRGSLDGRIPIVVDENTLKWIYFKELGSVFEIEPSPGRTVELIVVGVLSPSVLSGSFVMSEENLRSLYPSSAGYDLFLVKGEASRENMKLLRDHFSELGPRISSMRDLALENLDAELSYMRLFRDFLLLGVSAGLAALVLFNHSRALRFRRQMVLLRAVGVTRSRARTYIFLENLYLMAVSIIASVIGCAATVYAAGRGVTDGVDWSGIVSSGAWLLLLIIGISAAASILSALYAVSGYDRMVPRGNA